MFAKLAAIFAPSNFVSAADIKKSNDILAPDFDQIAAFVNAR